MGPDWALYQVSMGVPSHSLTPMLFYSCLTHIINLATQLLIGEHSKSPHYDLFHPKDHIPDMSAPVCDEVGMVRAIAVKVSTTTQIQVAPSGTFICQMKGAVQEHLPEGAALVQECTTAIYWGNCRLSGNTRSRPSPSCSIAIHHFLILDPHHGLLSNLRAHHVYHGLYRVTSDLRIYHVPMFLDLACVWQLTWWLGTV